MPSYVRPSLILNVDIDERDFSDEAVADIKRLTDTLRHRR